MLLNDDRVFLDHIEKVLSNKVLHMCTSFRHLSYCFIDNKILLFCIVYDLIVL